MKMISFISLLLFMLGQNCEFQNNGNLEKITIAAPALQNNLMGTQPERDLVIYLPPSFRKSDIRYPVIYFLPGFTCPLEEYLDGIYQGFKLKEALDLLLSSGKIKETIIVIPDGGNVFGGAFYVNSPVTGNWEDFVVDDLVQYIDANYRTIANRESRAISGHSMGGFGAMHIGMRHPEIFSCVYSLSPGLFAEDGMQKQGMFKDKITVQQMMKKMDELSSRATVRSHELFKTFIGDPYQPKSQEEYKFAFFCAYALAFAPNPSKQPFYFDFPFSKSGLRLKVDSTILARYEKGFGGWETKIIDNKSKLKQLKNITIDCGNNDDWITDGSRYLSKLLAENGIRHQYYEYDGGHYDKLRQRLEEFMFIHLSEKLNYKSEIIRENYEEP